MKHTMKRAYWALAAALALASLPAEAAAKSFVGVGAGLAHTAIRDPIANTVRATAVYPELGYRYQWDRRRSLQLWLSWMRMGTPARPGRIHARSQGSMLGVSYAWRWPLARRFQPHLRAGLEHIDFRVRERFLVDSEGFVIERLAPRAHRQYNLLVGFSCNFHDYGLGNWTIGLDWLDPFGLSRGFAGGVRTFVRYQFSLD